MRLTEDFIAKEMETRRVKFDLSGDFYIKFQCLECKTEATVDNDELEITSCAGFTAVCGKEEHTHTDAEYVIKGKKPEEEDDDENGKSKRHILRRKSKTIEEPREPEKELKCKKKEHTHEEECRKYCGATSLWKTYGEQWVNKNLDKFWLMWETTNDIRVPTKFAKWLIGQERPKEVTKLALLQFFHKLRMIQDMKKPESAKRPIMDGSGTRKKMWACTPTMYKANIECDEYIYEADNKPKR